MITRDEIDRLEKLTGQLEGIHAEMSALSKKSANDGVNQFKLKVINAVFVECNSLLQEAYRPFGDFTNFNLDDVPSNSDVTFIAAQYLQALEKYRSDNISQDNMGIWHYNLPKNHAEIRAARPAKLRK